MPSSDVQLVPVTSNSPLSKLLTGAGIELVTVLVSAVIGFALTPYMIRELGDRDYGLFVLIGSLTGWFGFVDLGLSSAVTRYVAVSFAKNNLNECTEYANTAFFAYLAMGAICLAIGCVIAGSLAWSLPNPADATVIPVLLILAAITFAIQLPLRALAGLISGCMRRDRTSLLRLTGRVSLAGVTFLVLSLGGRLMALSVVSMLAAFGSFLIWWKSAKWTLPAFVITPQHVRRDRFRSLLQFGGVAFAGNLTEAVLLRADALIISSFLAIAAVTHFNIAVTLAAIYQTLMVSLTAWLMNWFAHMEQRGREEVSRTLMLATRMTVVAGGFCLFGLTAWGHPFIHRWVGPEYLDVFGSLIALGTAVFFRAIQLPNTNLLYAVARHRQFVVAKVVEGVLNVFLGVLLVQRQGLTGVAVATLTASFIANGLLLSWFSCRISNVPMTKYYLNLLHSLLAVVAAAVLPAFLAYHYATPNYTTLAILGIVSALTYFPLAIVLATSTAERSDIATRLFPRFKFRGNN
jgi:O-antigen/teichoic acid export membrane protein